MAPKLYYFDFPGRAESTRLILTYGEVPFEDVRFPREEWPELKKKTPFGQVPAMELDDGTWLAQTHALERYAAALAGLLPSDPLQVALAEQLLFQVDDAYMLFVPTMKIQEPEAKIAARQELLKGAFGEKMQKLNALLEGKKYVLGDELCYVDLAVFTGLSLVICGWLDGVPPTLLDDYPALKAHHATVASLDKVKTYYEGKTGLHEAFKP